MDTRRTVVLQGEMKGHDDVLHKKDEMPDRGESPTCISPEDVMKIAVFATSASRPNEESVEEDDGARSASRERPIFNSRPRRSTLNAATRGPFCDIHSFIDSPHFQLYLHCPNLEQSASWREYDEKERA